MLIAQQNQDICTPYMGLMPAAVIFYLPEKREVWRRSSKKFLKAIIFAFTINGTNALFSAIKVLE